MCRAQDSIAGNTPSAKNYQIDWVDIETIEVKASTPEVAASKQN